jgi:hypothetical protein
MYAALGKPSYTSAAKEQYNKCSPFLLDVLAVNETIKKLKKEKKGYLVKAIEGVYFTLPDDDLKKGELNMRVLNMAFKLNTTENTIYRWLREARTQFALSRGLRPDGYNSYIDKTAFTTK